MQLVHSNLYNIYKNMYHEKMTSTKIREKICMYAFGS